MSAAFLAPPISAATRLQQQLNRCHAISRPPLPFGGDAQRLAEAVLDQWALRDDLAATWPMQDADGVAFTAEAEKSLLRSFYYCDKA